MAESRQKTISELLKSAREAAGAKKHGQAVAYYQQCLELALPKAEPRDNTIAYYYSSLAYSAMALNRYKLALESMANSLAYLDLESEYGARTLAWILRNKVYIEQRMSAASVRKYAHLLKVVQISRTQLDQLLARLLKPTDLKPERQAYTLHDTEIADPYSFLETALADGSDHIRAKECQEWLNKEIERSEIALQLMRSRFRTPADLYTAGWSQLHWLPSRVGPYYIFMETKLHTHHVIVRRSTSLGNKGRVIYDSSRVLADNEQPAGCRVSPNGQWMVYGASPNGSDRSYWRVRNLATGKDLPGKIENVLWGNIYFSPDGKGLLYQFSESREGGLGHRSATYYRKLGSARHRVFHEPYSADADRSSPELLFGNKFVLFSERLKFSYNQRVYLRPNKQNYSGKPLNLFPGKPGRYKWLGWKDRKLYFLTRHNAPRGRILMVELHASFTKVLRTVEIVPESDENIIDACFNQDAIVVSSLTGDGSHNKLRVYKHSGALWRDLELPFDGTVSSISGAYRGSEFFFSISAADRPRANYYHVFKSGKTRLLHDATFRPSLPVVNKVELVRSADGTMVPMHISHRADLKRDRAAPCLMSVYGGFAHAMLPGFNYQAWCWISEGGIYVQPYLRGGSELGDDWHLQATKLNKRKTYEDTLACAQFLIKEGYTSASRLAIMGASNGGLTVGAVLARRPDLFGAAIITNGLLDMIKFADHSNGWSWMSEYGSVRNEAEFDCIISYSPYHNINTRKAVPPVFFSASDSDDRVPAWHSYKYAARLAHKKTNFRSIMSVKRSQGHSSNRPSNTALNELVFLQYIFGMQQIDDS